MHSDGPSQSKRILGESTHQFLLHLALLLIVLIAVRLPRAVRHHVGFTTFDSYLYLILRQLGHHPTLMRIVASKHHLSTHLQLHGLIHREALLLELTRDSTLVGVLLCLNLSKTFMIDVISSPIERSQCDHCPILFCRLADTLIQMHQNLRCRLVQANTLKDFEESLIFLAIHLLELNLHHSHTLDDVCLVEEAIVCMIEVTHQIAFHTFLQYRRQLEHIPHEDHLLTSEWQ